MRTGQKGKREKGKRFLLTHPCCNAMQCNAILFEFEFEFTIFPAAPTRFRFRFYSFFLSLCFVWTENLVEISFLLRPQCPLDSFMQNAFIIRLIRCEPYAMLCDARSDRFLSGCKFLAFAFHWLSTRFAETIRLKYWRIPTHTMRHTTK